MGEWDSKQEWTCELTRHLGVPLIWADRHDTHCTCSRRGKERLAEHWAARGDDE